MKDELFKEFDTKFIEIHKFDETDDGCWKFKNIHFLDIIKWIDENFVPLDAVVRLNKKQDKPGRGYYLVKFYNHQKIKIMFFNGDRFEGFKSDDFIHDEIERWKKLTINGA